MFKTLAVLLLGSAFLAGCGADKDDAAAEVDVPAPATEMEPLPQDESAPTESADAMPSDDPDPAMSDSLPTAENPPPMEPAPPPGR